MADVQYLIDGVDLEVAGTRLMQVIEGAHVMAEMRGDLITYPGKDGQVFVDRPFDSCVVSFGLAVVGPTRSGFNDALQTLRRLIKPGRTVTMSRVLQYSGGPGTHTCLATYAGGLEPVQVSPGTFRMVLRMLNLDGLWYGSTGTFTAGAGITVLGDVRTRRMTITLSGGTNPTLTNSTNGWALTYTGSTSTSVVIDVENMTATQGASDVSGNLSFTKDWPMQLEAGSNSFVCSSGSASITYYPAFL